MIYLPNRHDRQIENVYFLRFSRHIETTTKVLCLNINIKRRKEKFFFERRYFIPRPLI